MTSATSRSNAGLIDPLAARLQFERRARGFDAHDFFHREVESRLLERLDPLRIEPTRAIDLGCGTGHALGVLAERYPRADWTAVDLAGGMLARARVRAREAAGLGGTVARLLGRVGMGGIAQRVPATRPGAASLAGAGFVQADFARLPFADNSFDLLWSNLALHYAPDIGRVVGEWSRIARPGAALMFSCLGPDSLRELRAIWPGDAPRAFVPFADMHDLGDLMVHSGFVDPVMGMERITLTYADPTRLLSELRALTGNPLAARAPRLHARRLRADFLAALDGARNADGVIPVTIEVVYGHAWAGEPRQKREPLPGGGEIASVPVASLKRGGRPNA
ncbi:methyltransferase domain-containing protein [Derxia gummosa]|uniref:Malonyl-[acyl-carrier protein] O-methyltransferase n=1 Tax=Derxia gummosa DSM 723 TaxID=1121388 RepID=A0A8B6X9Y1_9BURK|nr:methyltransferase domain-containing protein [Derxia gummosa]